MPPGKSHRRVPTVPERIRRLRTRAAERHLRRILNDYFAHYHSWRCHQSLEMDCPEPRAVQPPEGGEVVEAGGLYRHYERVAA
jgi:hypothetical protein